MKQTLTEKFRTNPYFVGTIVLGGMVILLLIVLFSQGQNAQKEISSWKDTICENTKATPSWFDYEGFLVYQGYIPFFKEQNNKTIALANKSFLQSNLIDEKISFLYNDNCSWCDKQILEFKTLGFWEEYKQNGLTINCSN